MPAYHLARDLEIDADVPSGFDCHMTVLPGEALDITQVWIVLSCAEPTVPAPMMLTWREPMHEIHHKWNPDCFESRFLDVGNHTRHRFVSRGYRGAPIASLHRLDGINSVTFALSDAMHATQLITRTAEDGHMDCCVRLFHEPWPAITEHNVILRIDRRALPIHTCIQSCVSWWNSLIPGPALPVPEAAKTARYCTWYTYHGKFSDADTERQCALAKELGMGTFGYEAGWSEGLDHQPDPTKYADFKQHVEAIHRHGLKFILWVTPSLVYAPTKAVFGDKLLGARDALGKLAEPARGVPDPRYPDVREYLVESYVRIVKDYDIDGFFIDFIECFGVQHANESEDPGRDYVSVPEAVDQLCRDIAGRLQEICPDILIELRQPSVGPHMVKVANMMRAVDCGNCFADNRLRILDIRMLCGSIVAHSDPIMWNTDEPVESAALQLTHTLFGVPQVSMDLEALPPDHTEMLRTYLSFWNRNRDVILDGELTPMAPHEAYPVVLSSTAGKWLAAIYSNAVIPVPAQAPNTLLVVNGTYRDHVVLDCEGDLGVHEMVVTSCIGRRVSAETIDLTRGLHRIAAPVNAYLEFKRMEELGT